MAAVRALLSAAEASRPRTRAMAILSAYRRLDVPYAPREVEMGGLARRYEIVERFGDRKPLVRRGGHSLRTENMRLVLGYLDPQQPVEGAIALLKEFAEFGDLLTVAYGPMERGIWRITDMGVHVTMRRARTSEITRAEVSLTFTEASDVKIKVGPVSGGTKPAGTSTPPATRSTATTATRPTATRPTTYTVKRGDTLSGIAARLLGNAGRWREIATLNGVKDPRKLRVGQVLRIPAR